MFRVQNLLVPVVVPFFTVLSSILDRVVDSKAAILNMNDDSAKLIRVLCLHGYGQNANIFRSKLGGVRKRLKRRIEFTFIDAPHIVKECEDSDQIGRAWCLRRNDGKWDPKGLEDSLKHLGEYCTENGPFDGLLAFSQGVDAAAILCTLPTYNFKFVILVAGCKLSLPDFAMYYENEIKVPSLHVMGENDTIIVKKRSEELRDCFCPDSTETIIHEGGHYIPNNKNICDTFIAFIDRYLHQQ